jgi:hypothetical protein
VGYVVGGAVTGGLVTGGAVTGGLVTGGAVDLGGEVWDAVATGWGAAVTVGVLVVVVVVTIGKVAWGIEEVVLMVFLVMGAKVVFE